MKYIYPVQGCIFTGDPMQLGEHWDSLRDDEHRRLAFRLSQETTDAALVAEVEAQEDFVNARCRPVRPKK